jgi:hypothetical protein
LDILKVVEESPFEGHMHAPLNSTFIALIPKNDLPHSLEYFRPISLCNCIYKVVAKVIAKRIKTIYLHQYPENNLASWREDRYMKQSKWHKKAYTVLKSRN